MLVNTLIKDTHRKWKKDSTHYQMKFQRQEIKRTNELERNPKTRQLILTKLSTKISNPNHLEWGNLKSKDLRPKETTLRTWTIRFYWETLVYKINKTKNSIHRNKVMMRKKFTWFSFFVNPFTLCFPAWGLKKSFNQKSLNSTVIITLINLPRPNNPNQSHKTITYFNLLKV